MKAEHERWAEALAVERSHGDDAPAFIGQRIGELARNGDYAGVGRWKEIAVAYDQLRGGPLQ